MIRLIYEGNKRANTGSKGSAFARVTDSLQGKNRETGTESQRDGEELASKRRREELQAASVTGSWRRGSLSGGLLARNRWPPAPRNLPSAASLPVFVSVASVSQAYRH